MEARNGEHGFVEPGGTERVEARNGEHGFAERGGAEHGGA
jgi:hypothetical protein